MTIQPLHAECFKDLESSFVWKKVLYCITDLLLLWHFSKMKFQCTFKLVSSQAVSQIKSLSFFKVNFLSSLGSFSTFLYTTFTIVTILTDIHGIHTNQHFGRNYFYGVNFLIRVRDWSLRFNDSSNWPFAKTASAFLRPGLQLPIQEGGEEFLDMKWWNFSSA